MAPTHPHILHPTEEQLAELIASWDLSIQQTYMDAHRLMLATVPDISCSVDESDHTIGYGAHQFGYNGWGMAALSPHRRWVSLVFLRGVDLPDSQGLLEGSGVALRSVKLSSVARLDELRQSITSLIEAAANLNS